MPEASVLSGQIPLDTTIRVEPRAPSTRVSPTAIPITATTTRTPPEYAAHFGRSTL